jgi:hypothetical protein
VKLRQRPPVRFGCRQAPDTPLRGSRKANLNKSLQELGADVPGIGPIRARMYLADMLAISEDWADELKLLSTRETSQAARHGERGLGCPLDGDSRRDRALGPEQSARVR